jgi:sortase A
MSPVPSPVRRVLALLGALAVVVTAAVVGAVAVTDGDDDGSTDPAAPTASAPGPAALNPVVDASSFRPVAVNSLDPDPLPVPERPPEDPYADVPVPEIGQVEIPEIGLVHPIFEGITLTVIDNGPGHWPGSALPGRRGNTVFPGHRTTHSQPFHDLDRLAPGDEIVFRTPDGVHTYAVRETHVVAPTDMWVVDQTETPTVTLVACHPKGSARQRIVVKGDLLRSEPSPAARAAADRLGALTAQLAA